MRSKLYVRFRPALGLVVISGDGERNEESTILTLSPQEAVEVGNALIKHGTANGGKP